MLHVLCLHGAQQTAEIFEQQLSKLALSLRGIATLHFIDAPVLLSKAHAEDSVRTRSWCTVSPDASTSEDEDYGAGDAVLEAALQTRPYDILLGFSQGAMMICRLFLRHGATSALLRSVKGVVVAGAPYPDALATAVAARVPHAQSGLMGGVPSLHIIGKADRIVDPSESRALAAACGPRATIFYHDHAHSVPQLRALLEAVRDVCRAAAAAAPEAHAAEVDGVAEGNKTRASTNEDEEEAAASAEQLQQQEAARAEELELLMSMYGEDCVLHLSHTAVTYVRLPLLPELEGTSEVERHLRGLQLEFQVPRRYPMARPRLDLLGGAAVQGAAFARWRAARLAEWTRHMHDSFETEAGMTLLTTYLDATNRAQEQLDELRALLTDGGTTNGDSQASGGARKVRAETGKVACVSAEAWAAEEDGTTRTERIAAAEQAIEALMQDGTLQRLLSAAGTEAEDEAAAAGASTMGVMDAAESSGSGGGSWRLTIGLIGKPSAGKSTFFNAVTDPDDEASAARVAAFPFTTIEPNVGTGFGPVFCPCTTLYPCARPDAAATSSSPLCTSFERCDAEYGHVHARPDGLYRRHPILVKDVAGLVQGAYEGKGRGNQFLNDLCDADVLVHVVDGAAATDAGGTACVVGQGSTLQDITWVRAEVHSWIYDNLCRKWQVIQRQPAKLRGMFTGYHSTPSFVDTVLRGLGVRDAAALAQQVRSWGPAELHRLVALYVRLRFPMVVALNKADLPTAAALTAQLRARHPHETFVPLSAKVEWELLQLRHRGLVRYVSGEPVFEAVAKAGMTPAETRMLQRAQAFFAALQAQGTPDEALLGSTGVQDVLAAALARCAAVLVYPVRAFRPAVPSLRHCYSYKQGTTAETVYWGMTYDKLLDGKLVRFEVMDAHRGEGGATMLKKTDVIPVHHALVRVLTNRRQMA